MGTQRGETYRAWTFCWVVSRLQCWRTMDDISRMWRELYSLSVFAIGGYFNLFGTSRVIPYSGKVHIRIRILYSDPDAHIELGQIPGRAY